MNEDKKLIAYCGLYCGDCVNYKGEVADLARDLRKKLRQEKFNRVSKGLYAVVEFVETEADLRFAISGNVAKKRIFKAVGNVRNLKLAAN
jgi:hypothetical protein